MLRGSHRVVDLAVQSLTRRATFSPRPPEFWQEAAILDREKATGAVAETGMPSCRPCYASTLLSSAHDGGSHVLRVRYDEGTRVFIMERIKIGDSVR